MDDVSGLADRSDKFAKFLDNLIVMDDVSGLADRSDKFARFLTVSRKYGLTFFTPYARQDRIGK